MIMSVFFFQAEDGIRDLVRSRGLGDVYKRQSDTGGIFNSTGQGIINQFLLKRGPLVLKNQGPMAVSYTHLTLPTSDLV